MKKSIIQRALIDSGETFQGVHPILQRVYAGRGIASRDDVSRELKDLLPFSFLAQIDRAVERLFIAIKQAQSILILGDFDVDGASSTALAVSALTAFGAKSVSYLVPDRFIYGYGLTPEIVAVAAERKPDLIVTVDNGISSHTGVAAANARKIDVVITDHHLPATTLPSAYAIVNPHCQHDAFPSKCLAGVGVIFYVMLGLRARLKKENWFIEQNRVCPNMAEFLDFVALGTVADLVPLDKNNRILIYQGLQRMRAGKAHPGILALIAVSGRAYVSLEASDLGFFVAPPLNAAGRLKDMSLGIRCLLATDPEIAKKQAQELYSLNRERRVIEAEMKRDAFLAIEALDWQAQNWPSALCLYRENWHQGIIGLVASRVKERIHRPVIAFAKADDETLKGSARSVPGLHIRDILAEIAAQHPTVISKFGGHAMAAGLSLPLEQFHVFQPIFSQIVEKHLKAEDRVPKLLTDGELRASELNLPLAELLRAAGPWGQGFPEPQFSGNFKLIDQRIVGGLHLKLTLQLFGGSHYINGIAFNVDLNEWPNFHSACIRMVYRLDINEYKGCRQLQLIIAQMEAIPFAQEEEKVDFETRGTVCF